MPAFRLNDFPAGYSLLKRGDILGARGTLEQHDDEARRSSSASFENGFCLIMLFHSSGARTKKSISIPKRFHRFSLQETLQLRTGPRSAPEHDIATLKQRSGVIEPKLREKVAQVGHTDAAVAADVDAAEEGDMSCQIDQRPVSDTQTT